MLPANVVSVPSALVNIEPPSLKTPEPLKEIVPLVFPAEPATLPETITVPVEIVIECLTAAPPLVNATLPAFKLPAPTAIVFKPAPDRGIVIAPDTLRVIPLFIVREVAVTFVKVIDAQAAFAVTVTLNPPSIVTTSPATGKIPAPTAGPPELSDHVVFVFQLPVALEKYVAANDE